MNEDFDFRDLFVFDLANNHQGRVDHALKIIRGIGEVARGHRIRSALKFQFRELDTFVHRAHQAQTDNKHIPRFLGTRLSRAEFETLRDAVRTEGMLPMCTPFDEESVDVTTEMGFDVLKVASCSARDWPLLEKIAEAGLPIVFSTGGLQLGEIDDLVSFFEHRGSDFAIMHCVSIYPIPPSSFNLNQVDVLRERYRNRVIGWSTHESPEDTVPVQLAVAKGARMFERHVGLPTADVKLNMYSSTPAQIDRWLSAYEQAVELCGSALRTPIEVEQDSINSLRRGVYARERIERGELLGRERVYFAMPYVEGQLDSGGWMPGIVAETNIEADAPVLRLHVAVPNDSDDRVLKDAVHEVKALLNEARIALNSEFAVEYSHHYGIPKFRKYGTVIISCINREYCKKILVQLPGQIHPPHFHKLKEETFQVLHGALTVSIDGQVRTVVPGQTLLVLPGVWHSFWTDQGCVFEEISTTHYNNDSVYKDAKINKLHRHERKTIVDHWGRFQLPAKVRSARAT